MKLSEKYLQSKRNGHGGLSLTNYEAETFGNICTLEGKIKALNSFGTNQWVDKLLPKYRKQLKSIATYNNL